MRFKTWRCIIRAHDRPAVAIVLLATICQCQLRSESLPAAGSTAAAAAARLQPAADTGHREDSEDCLLRLSFEFRTQRLKGRLPVYHSWYVTRVTASRFEWKYNFNSESGGRQVQLQF